MATNGLLNQNAISGTMFSIEKNVDSIQGIYSCFAINSDHAVAWSSKQFSQSFIDYTFCLLCCTI